MNFLKSVGKRIEISAVMRYYFFLNRFQEGAAHKFDDYISKQPHIDLLNKTSKEETFNCFSYVFNQKDFSINFMRQMEMETDFYHEPKEGCQVWYFSSGSSVHIGFFEKDGRVRSKWGNGPILKHPMWKVPLEYGSRVKYCDVPSKAHVKDLQARVDAHEAQPLYKQLLAPFDLKEFFSENIENRKKEFY